MTSLPTLLVVFAHPDDEAFPTGGVMAHYAEKGHKVYLACATKGEAGQLKDPSLGDGSDMASIRVRELEASCAALGVEPPIFLGWHDSGRNERLRLDDPKALHNADLWAVEQTIRDVIAQVKPTVMITFDPHGGYGHPDHLVIHRAATAAFFSTGHFPHPPQRLFYSAWTIERMQQMQASGQSNNIVGGLEPTLYGVDPNTLALTMDVSAYVPQKMAAAKAHRSQFAQLTSDDVPAERRAQMEKMFSREAFSLGGTRGAIVKWPLSGLFDDL
jgi:N-acetyl-1-D-myo-inositol-2-amino-2-deoxy-alpha-D-glucopyranoside deacetylase